MRRALPERVAQCQAVGADTRFAHGLTRVTEDAHATTWPLINMFIHELSTTCG